MQQPSLTLSFEIAPPLTLTWTWCATACALVRMRRRAIGAKQKPVAVHDLGDVIDHGAEWLGTTEVVKILFCFCFGGVFVWLLDVKESLQLHAAAR
jgi:hypothetical protein